MTATDDPGVTVACVPPSGSMFPVRHDYGNLHRYGYIRQYSDLFLPVTVFNGFLQDDSDPTGSLFLMHSRVNTASAVAEQHILEPVQ